MAAYCFHEKPSRFSGLAIRQRRSKGVGQRRWVQLQDSRKEAEYKLRVLQEEAMRNVTRIRERLGQLRDQAREADGVGRRQMQQQVLKQTKLLAKLEAESNRLRAKAKTELREYDERIEEAAKKEGQVISLSLFFGDDELTQLTTDLTTEQEGPSHREASPTHRSYSFPKAADRSPELVTCTCEVTPPQPQRQSRPKSPKCPSNRVPKLPLLPPPPSPSQSQQRRRLSRSNGRQVVRNLTESSRQDASLTMPSPVRLPPPAADMQSDVSRSSGSSELKPLYRPSQFHVPRLDLQWEARPENGTVGDSGSGVYPRSDHERQERYRLAQIFSIPDLEHRGAEMERHLDSARDSGGTPRKIARIQMLIEQQSHAREARRQAEGAATPDSQSSSRRGRLGGNGRGAGQQCFMKHARV